MREELKKRENEEFIEYCARLYSSKIELGLNNKEIYEVIKKETDTNQAESTVRCNAYLWNKACEHTIEKMADKEETNITEQIEKIEELKYERAKTRAEKSELNRLINKHSKFDLFYENVKEAIKTLPLPQFENINDNSDNKLEGWILTLSDIHYGADFISENNIYNRNIAKERFELLLSKTYKLIERNNIKELTILGIGDELQGILRLSDCKLNDISVVDCVVEVSRLIATFLNELSKKVKVTYRHNIYSNHTQTRPLGSKSNSMPSEDLSKIIGNYIKDLLGNNDRVSVILSEKEYGLFDMVGQTIMFAHGHTIKNIKNVIKDYSIMTRKFIDIAFLGHFHAGQSMNVGELNGSTSVIVAPSFIGSDPYSDSLSLGAKAMCELHKIEAWQGVVETYKIILN